MSRPARGDVAGDEQPDLALPEAVQGLGPFRLRHVAMQRRSIEAVPDQRFEQDVDIALAVAEDQRVLDVFGSDQPAQRLALVARVEHGERLDDGGGGRSRRGYRDFDRIAEKRVGELADFRRHRRREEQGLPRFRQQADDALDIGNKAHVEHPVGLVDDENMRVGQQDLAAPMQIEQPSRRGDQHIDAAVELAFLVDKTFAADQQRHGQAMMLAVKLESCGDLGRQLAGRLDDQRARHPRPGAPGRQLVDHRQHKARRFAGPGLGAAEHVPPALNVGDRLFLDRGGSCIAGVGNRLKNFRRQIKFGKTHGYVVAFL